MAIKLEDKTRVVAPSGTYPFGDIKDTTPTDKGTPVNKQVYGDFHQFFAKMLNQSGITANGLPDNLTNGFQYYQSLVNVMNSGIGVPLINTLLGNAYSLNKVFILQGCEIVANIPGTSSITAGYAFYNGIFYAVPANPTISSPSNTLVFKIDSSVQPGFMYLSNAVAGTGIDNYDDVARFHKKYLQGTDVFESATLSVAGSVILTNVVGIKRGGMVYISGEIQVTLDSLMAADTGFHVDVVLKPDFEYEPTDFPNSNLYVGNCSIVKISTIVTFGGGGFIRTTGTSTTLRIGLSNSKDLAATVDIPIMAHYKAKHSVYVN